MAAPLKILVTTLLVLATALGLATWWALESSGVATIQTRTPDGAVRTTHVWFAEPGTELWVEAGHPSNPWFTDAQRNPAVLFQTSDRSSSHTAEIIDDPDARSRLRSLLRAKYGIRDWWVGVLFDASHSVAVRFVARQPTPGEPGATPQSAIDRTNRTPAGGDH